ncbi:DUF3993 domain-containing protein [Metabacillus idriensis]|uniref:DUF3993 domain-containing protein n=1 Tax=Metabacillus idriensis TaxID=324768 RepID=UPI00174B67E1|nr:DUF3993 domain-containing protein [Metabacillus idriensis]
MKLFSSIFAALILFFAFGQAGHAEAAIGKQEAVDIVQNAAEAQLALTETERSLEEIEKTLSPYFTDEFISEYMKENVQKGENEYIVYGSDFTSYGIPFFNYNEKMEFGRENSTLKLYQFFEGEDEGPVSYEDHYEAVEFKEEDGGYKISSIEYADEEPKIEAVHTEKNTEDSPISISMLFSKTISENAGSGMEYPEALLNKKELVFDLSLWTSYFKAKNFLTAYFQSDDHANNVAFENE